MSIFSRWRRDEEPAGDPNDPLAALAKAEKALEDSDGWASDGNGHWSKMPSDMNETLAKVREQLESGGGARPGDPRFAPTPTSSFGQPERPPLVEDPISRVERLAKLLHDGDLTQEEYEEQKRKALEG